MFKRIFIIALLIPIFLKAQSVDPLRAKDEIVQEIWVDSIMQTMTIDQKIGQLFMLQAYSNRDAKHKNFIKKMITKYHVGNLIFMQGTPEKQIKLNNEYQKIAKIPLLIGFDGEWGLDMRLKNTYRFPWNMTLGAIQDKKLIEKVGERIGEHCKRVGIHVNFAPVVDVNTNPDNPIIGNRSFGETKENVAEQSIAFTKGMQSAGVLANAKHFPGHGDTATDSHHTLPTINFDRERIDNIELYPFREQFDAGVASVMTAHLSIPSLEPNKVLPSSLSKNVVTDLLQYEMGFNGLIFTDGLNMKGAANYSTSAEINLGAILAGNDVLLIPQEIPKTIQYFKKSLKNGTLTEERINHSVRKILRAKYLVGLHEYKPSSTENIQEDLHTFEDKILHRNLVKASLTVIKNENNTIPIKNLETKKIAYVPLGDDKGDSFAKMLQNYAKVEVVTDKDLNKLIKKLHNYNLVIIGFHKSNANPWKSYKFSKKDLTWLQEIAKNKNIILDVFASPYSLLQIKKYTNIESIMVSYQNSKLSQELSAQAIFGAFSVNGKLPVSIHNHFEVGAGITTESLNRLEYSIPEDVGMSSKKLQEIEKYVDTILKKKMAPGGQVLVARHGKVIYNKPFGHHTHLKKKKVKNSDIYDVASLTKILATLPVIMKAEEDKKLSIFSSLGDLLPSFRNTNKDTVQVKEMLSHYARLASWIPFYLRTKNKYGRYSKKYYSAKKTKKFSIQVAKNLYLNKVWKDSIETIIKDVSQKPRLRYKYSDIGYYLFKDILEKKYDKRLDKLVDEEFYQSLGLDRTSYLPLKKFKKAEIVPTEKDTYFRNQLLHGYVHDMGAAMQGGVGGHAGLFSNANDIAKIMQLYLQKGTYGGIEYLQPETVDKFNTRYYAEAKNRRGLGFDKPQINPEEKPTCGCVSESSFGHSGFTGTYAWADPESEIVYVFLSNRVYPTMKNKGLVKSNMRTKIQQAIQDAIVN